MGLLKKATETETTATTMTTLNQMVSEMDAPTKKPIHFIKKDYLCFFPLEIYVGCVKKIKPKTKSRINKRMNKETKHE